MVKQSDVLIESFRPGTMEKWGLGYEHLKNINLRLIMLRVSGYGQEGPKSQEPGYDRVAQAYGGLTYVTGYPDQPPVRSGFTVADYGAAFLGWGGILTALYYRDAVGTGEGQMIDVSLYDPLVAQWTDMIIAYDRFGVKAERTGNTVVNVAPGNTYMTRDGKWVQISASNNNIFSRLMKVIGKEELVKDERFLNNYKRYENRDELEKFITEWAQTVDTEELLKLCLQSGIPVSLVNSVEEILQDDHIRFRGSIVDVEDPVLGKFKMQGIVPKMLLTPGEMSFVGANIGEHNREVYTELLGLREEEICRYKENGII